MNTFTIGQEAKFEATFTLNENPDSLTNTDSPPSFEILDSSNNIIFEGISTKKTKGVYVAKWLIPIGLEQGNFRIKWNAYLGGVSIDGLFESFRIALPKGSTIQKVNDFDIIIPQIELELIKKVLAYPCADELLLSDSQVKSYCVFPAMREYFAKFPIIQREEYSISTYIELPFPDQFIFGLTECRIVDKLFQGGSSTSFWRLIAENNRSGNRGFGSYGSKMRGYNPNGLQQQTRMNRKVIDTMANDATFNYHINRQKKQIEVSSTLSGALLVHWAKWSNDFSMIDYERRNEVIMLAQAYLLEHFAQTIGLTDDGNTDQTINGVDAGTKAETLRSEVMEKWNSMSDVVVMRVS